MFEILEEKFSAPIIRLIVPLLLASREGLLETEIITLLRNSNLVNGKTHRRACRQWLSFSSPPSGSTTKLWTHFCWKMGPLFLHNKNIILVDRALRKVAERRYAAEIPRAHQLLHDYYDAQPNLYVDRKGKDKW